MKSSTWMFEIWNQSVLFSDESHSESAAADDIDDDDDDEFPPKPYTFK